VRDGLRRRLAARPDLDLVVPVEAIALCRTLSRRMAGSAWCWTPKRSDRQAGFERAGASIWHGRWGGAWEADSGSADFASMPWPATAAGAPLLDPPLGPSRTWPNGQVVAVAEAIAQDPLRCCGGSVLAPNSVRAGRENPGLIQAIHHLITQVAPERVLAELEKLAGCP